MRVRTLALSLVLAALAVIAVLVVRPRWEAEAQPVDTFDPLRDRLRTFETAFLEFLLRPGGGRVADTGWVVEISTANGPRVAIDPPPGGSPRYVWDGQQLATIGRGTIPRPAPRVATISTPPHFRQVWEEVRTGFANSVVTHDPPSSLGYRGSRPKTRGNDWVMIQLPFAWAADYRIFVHYVVRTQAIAELVVLNASTGQPVNGLLGKPFHFVGGDRQRWDVPLEPGAFQQQSMTLRPSATGGLLSVGADAGPAASVAAAARGVDRELMRTHEACEGYDGHEHGAQLHQEHSDAEIHGDVIVP